MGAATATVLFQPQNYYQDRETQGSNIQLLLLPISNDNFVDLEEFYSLEN